MSAHLIQRSTPLHCSPLRQHVELGDSTTKANSPPCERRKPVWTDSALLRPITLPASVMSDALKGDEAHQLLHSTPLHSPLTECSLAAVPHFSVSLARPPEPEARGRSATPG